MPFVALTVSRSIKQSFIWCNLISVGFLFCCTVVLLFGSTNRIELFFYIQIICIILSFFFFFYIPVIQSAYEIFYI